ncbi:DMT family transporter [Shimia ponticola]|uniref:DMT family transporter n=1 Tax=Shimia ponticola TaxID=2582893 RepID=UPI0011BF9784|nr:DMT family transporter [Shimia ponticola]
MSSILRGSLLISAAMLIFTVMSAFIKATAPEVPAGQSMFFRAAFAIPVILVWLWWDGALPSGLKTQNWVSHAKRGIVGSCAMGLGFWGLGLIPLPEAAAIRFATPIILVVLAAVMLGERIRMFRISAVFMGLIGVLIILWPRLGAGLSDGATLGAMVTLASAALAALAQVFVKGMAGRETTAAIVFYFSLTAATLSLVTVPYWVWPSFENWLFLIGAGIIGGFGQICLTSSYKYAEAGALAPFTYTSMLWSVLIGWLWFAELPTVWMLAGGSLVIAAGALIVWRERALGQDRTARRKVRAKGIQ